jgi:serine/threonine protein kinase
MFSCFIDRNNGYALGELIGRGSYGSVYRATKRGLTYVFKRIQLLPDRAEDKERILREVQVLKFVSSSSYFPRIVDGWRNDEEVTIVMESFDCDLREVIHNLEHTHVRYIAKQLFQAIAYLHSAGIMHRDIKPANILINAFNCRAVLCDFNLAKSIGVFDLHSPKTQEVCSRWYRAPELLCKNSSYDFSIDIWAAACVVAEMMLGRPLWAGISDTDQLRKIVSTLGQPSPKDFKDINYSFVEPCSTKIDLPFECEDFLRKCFVYSPCERLTAIQALAHPWLNASQDSVFLSAIRMKPVRLTLPKNSAIYLDLDEELKSIARKGRRNST